jgi:nitrous oxidase accessory protein NosD
VTGRRLAMVATLLIVAACSGPMVSVGIDQSLSDAIAAAPDGTVLHLAPGAYRGPIVIDRPIELIGEPGTVIEAPPDGPAILIESDDVTIRDLAVKGGDAGIHVVDVVNVVLDGVEVRGAEWHGILVDDSAVEVRDCLIWGMGAQLAQGFEIRNAVGRPESVVERCRIEGPLYEGLVAHVSHVRFVDNEVTGSREHGLSITEMSDGRMEGNTVTNAQGNAYFCGDMSRCSVVDNMADGIGDSSQGSRSGGGHAVVIHSLSAAYVDGLSWNDIAGDPMLVMLDGEIAPDSLYP